MTAPHQWTAQECAVKVGQRSIQATEVAAHFIERVTRINPSINALVQFRPDDVLRQAREVDARIDAGEHLPMAGVAVTVKDNLWVEAFTVTQGSRLFKDFVAPRDAWVVQRLRALGAVVLGITNCSEFACKGATDNLVYGTTRHPADLKRTPGGSSGGAVAALASGLGLLALGTDAGGSVRRPAAHTGLVGHKPSQGLVPNPWGFGEPNYGVSVVGLLAKNVADCAWFFDQVGDFDASDASAPPLPVDWQALQCSVRAPSKDVRIAWSPRLGCGFAIDADIRLAIERVVDRLASAGWNVAQADPLWGESVSGYPMDALQHAGLHALHGRALQAATTEIDPHLRAQIESGALKSASDRASVLRARDRIQRDLGTFFSNFDLLLCPTVPVIPWDNTSIAPTHVEGRTAGLRDHAVFTPLFNLCGVPACSVPVATVRGFPVGLQIVAPRFQDPLVFAFAGLMERLLARSSTV